MIKLNHSSILEEILPEWLLLQYFLWDHFSVHQGPRIKPALFQSTYTFPASIPATKAPVKMFSIKNLIMMIPMILIFRIY